MLRRSVSLMVRRFSSLHEQQELAKKVHVEYLNIQKVRQVVRPELNHVNPKSEQYQIKELQSIMKAENTIKKTQKEDNKKTNKDDNNSPPTNTDSLSDQSDLHTPVAELDAGNQAVSCSALTFTLFSAAKKLAQHIEQRSQWKFTF